MQSNRIDVRQLAPTFWMCSFFVFAVNTSAVIKFHHHLGAFMVKVEEQSIDCIRILKVYLLCIFFVYFVWFYILGAFEMQLRIVMRVHYHRLEI